MENNILLNFIDKTIKEDIWRKIFEDYSYTYKISSFFKKDHMIFDYRLCHHLENLLEQHSIFTYPSFLDNRNIYRDDNTIAITLAHKNSLNTPIAVINVLFPFLPPPYSLNEEKIKEKIDTIKTKIKTYSTNHPNCLIYLCVVKTPDALSNEGKYINYKTPVFDNRSHDWYKNLTELHINFDFNSFNLDIISHNGLNEDLNTKTTYKSS